MDFEYFQNLYNDDDVITVLLPHFKLSAVELAQAKRTSRKDVLLHSFTNLSSLDVGHKRVLAIELARASKDLRTYPALLRALHLDDVVSSVLLHQMDESVRESPVVSDSDTPPTSPPSQVALDDDGSGSGNEMPVGSLVSYRPSETASVSSTPTMLEATYSRGVEETYIDEETGLITTTSGWTTVARKSAKRKRVSFDSSTRVSTDTPPSAPPKQPGRAQVTKRTTNTGPPVNQNGKRARRRVRTKPARGSSDRPMSGPVGSAVGSPATAPSATSNTSSHQTSTPATLEATAVRQPARVTRGKKRVAVRKSNPRLLSSSKQVAKDTGTSNQRRRRSVSDRQRDRRPPPRSKALGTPGGEVSEDTRDVNLRFHVPVGTARSTFEFFIQHAGRYRIWLN